MDSRDTVEGRNMQKAVMCPLSNIRIPEVGIAIVRMLAPAAKDIVYRHVRCGHWDGFIEHVRDYPEHGEWRFQGPFGFGGKLWWHWYDGFRVSMYPEDSEPNLVGIIEGINSDLNVVWKALRDDAMATADESSGTEPLSPQPTDSTASSVIPKSYPETPGETL